MAIKGVYEECVGHLGGKSASIGIIPQDFDPPPPSRTFEQISQAGFPYRADSGVARVPLLLAAQLSLQAGAVV